MMALKMNEKATNSNSHMHVEAQRILHVLEQTIHKIHLMSLLTRDIMMNSPEDVRESVHNCGEDMERCFLEQKRLEERYNELVGSKRLEQAVEVAVEMNQNCLNLCPDERKDIDHYCYM